MCGNHENPTSIRRIVPPLQGSDFSAIPNPGRCPRLVWFAPLGRRSFAPKGHPIPAKGNALVLKERRSALISAAVTGKIDVRSVAAVSNRQAQPSKTRHGG
jgi:hypothetical protein